MVRPLPAFVPLVGFTVSVMEAPRSLVLFALSFRSVLKGPAVMVSATTDGGAPGPRASPHPGRVVCGLSRGYGVWLGPRGLARRGLDRLDRRDLLDRRHLLDERGVLLHAEQRDLVLEV